MKNLSKSVNNNVYTQIDVIKTLCNFDKRIEKDSVRNKLKQVEDMFYDEPNASECMSDFYKTCVEKYKNVYSEGKPKSTAALTLNIFFAQGFDDFGNEKGIWRYYKKPETDDAKALLNKLNKKLELMNKGLITNNNIPIICWYTLDSNTDIYNNMDNYIFEDKYILETLNKMGMDALGGYFDKNKKKFKRFEIVTTEMRRNIIDVFKKIVNVSFKEEVWRKEARAMFYAYFDTFLKFSKIETSSFEEYVTDRVKQKLIDLGLDENSLDFLKSSERVKYFEEIPA